MDFRRRADGKTDNPTDNIKYINNNIWDKTSQLVTSISMKNENQLYEYALNFASKLFPEFLDEVESIFTSEKDYSELYTDSDINISITSLLKNVNITIPLIYTEIHAIDNEDKPVGKFIFADVIHQDIFTILEENNTDISSFIVENEVDFINSKFKDIVRFYSAIKDATKKSTKKNIKNEDNKNKYIYILRIINSLYIVLFSKFFISRYYIKDEKYYFEIEKYVDNKLLKEDKWSATKETLTPIKSIYKKFNEESDNDKIKPIFYDEGILIPTNQKKYEEFQGYSYVEKVYYKNEYNNVYEEYYNIPFILDEVASFLKKNEILDPLVNMFQAFGEIHQNGINDIIYIKYSGTFYTLTGFIAIVVTDILEDKYVDYSEIIFGREEFYERIFYNIINKVERAEDDDNTQKVSSYLFQQYLKFVSINMKKRYEEDNDASSIEERDPNIIFWGSLHEELSKIKLNDNYENFFKSLDVKEETLEDIKNAIHEISEENIKNFEHSIKIFIENFIETIKKLKTPLNICILY